MSSAHGLADVPAHRVVNRVGMLTGKMHFAPPSLMQKLLEQESVKVKKDKVQAFDRVFWDPIELIKELQ
jgi:methylated-DNA-protein-cysteine methyltransferase-like protein